MNLIFVPGMFVCSSFLNSVCMFIVSKALLISSATGGMLDMCLCFGYGGVVLCLCEVWVWILCADGRSRYLCIVLGGYLHI